MALWGYHALTAPFGSSASAVTTPPPSDGPSCGAGQQQKIVKYVSRHEVEVSVYNAGTRSGRAQATMNQLERAGFAVGAIGNAPSSMVIKKAAVHTKKADLTAATLVARALGKGTPVVIDETQDLGPGIDVFIGDSFRKLDPKAPTQLKLPQPKIVCG